MKTIIHDPINKRKLGIYIKKLEKEGKILEHGDLLFDKKSLLETRYTCDPRICLKVKNGVYHGSCCTDYSVDLSKEEEDKINKERDPFQDIPIGRYPKKEKEDKDRQVGEDTKGSKSE